MLLKNKVYSFALFLLVSIISGCGKEDTNTNNNTTPIDSFLVKSYNLYTGSKLDSLELSENYTFQYNSSGQVVSSLKTGYENGIQVGTIKSNFTYSSNMVIEKMVSKYIGNNGIEITSYYKLNNQKLIETDSSIDPNNMSSSVRKYTYENNKRIYRYVQDTNNGGNIFQWTGNNQTEEFMKYGTMPRFLIMSHIYGTKKNKNSTGDFWNNGEKSENLPEKSVEPNYEYNYTYKMDSDGFVTEKITAISSPGGTPYRYEKIVYTR